MLTKEKKNATLGIDKSNSGQNKRKEAVLKEICLLLRLC